MLIKAWKEAIHRPLSMADFTKQPDHSRPTPLPVREHEIRLDEFGYDHGGYREPIFAAVRHIVDGEVVAEQRFPNWRAAEAHCKRHGIGG